MNNNKLELAKMNARAREIKGILAEGDEGLQKRKFYAGADAIQEYDPELAMKYRNAAGSIQSRQDANRQLNEKNELAKDIQSKKYNMDEIKQLAIQYRNARNSAVSNNIGNLGEDAVKGVTAELNGLRNVLLADEFGRKLMGMVDAGQNIDIIDNTGAFNSSETTEEGIANTNTNTLNVDEERKKINSYNVDENKDGIIDNKINLDSYMSDLATKYGNNSSEYKQVKATYDSLIENVKKLYDAKEITRKEYKDEAKDLKTRAYDQKPMWTTLKDIQDNPEDISARSNALNIILREESGAAIGSDEYASKLQTWLSPKDYKDYISDLGGIKAYLAMKTGTERHNALRSLAKYLGKVNIKKIERSIKSYLQDDVIKYYEKSTPKPKINISGWK